MTINNSRYNITFTAGAAMLNETYAIAKTYLECNKDWKRTREITFSENLLQKEKRSSSQRYFTLIKQRIEALNEEEIHTLVTSTVAIRRLIVLLAICKAHSLIFDFIAIYVRDCLYNIHEKVTQSNFNEFYNEIIFEHPEIEKATEQTVAKMRQVIFRILEQTELVESAESGEIRRPYLSEEIERMIVKDDPKWLAIYLYSNNEILNLSELYA